MKKKIVGMFLIVCCLVLTGCARSITYQTLEEKINNKETVVVEIIQDGCSHCINFQPVFDKFTNENNIEYVKLNLTNMTSADKEKLNANYDIEGTPTVLIIKDGKELKEYKISGEAPVKTLKETFKKAGFIK